MDKSSLDDDSLRRALSRAESALRLTSPNPKVGCLLVSPSDQVIGQGHTQRAGGPHAEVMALRDAAAQGHSVVGATAYVTLEPCSHHGRTGPCCDALIAAGIKKVVATNLDPNPLVAGQGVARLRAAGVEVEVLDPADPLAIASRELNIGFFSRMVRKTPWVRMKVAASLDGTTALDNGASQWITSPEARADGHAWRARSCAILTGIGTVLADKPRLDVRLVETPRQPHLVVVDSDLQTPLDAPFFIAGRAVFIYAAAQNDAKRTALEAFGAKVIYLPGHHTDGKPTGKVDLAAMLKDLGQREINELHVEAGFKLNGSLLREGLVDEFVVYLAPKLLGQGAGMFNFGPLTELTQSVALDFKSTEMVGPDLRVVARVQGRDAF
ncbi:bifunctional diaminohydroxyphosphoribosylaminopyrimidine deaminase/5-amino-6-(5-phosphoribosylamino)uracil reductase RibD [Rhodoferax sp.]|uniref:bifunctional diaminohydroxyphosphoribosylaminopyrimidine deaminase/5-amino-6-(5-phosphoribosylamino)uracil reductase RibD n=1 Tax=Rhodoferax sp. TaxID=50421 RepID=UPI002ACD87DF|nr:bifunctional diaminohydroxyphosphoribosylaminopyrimidine deaminase/5-amino-6-(5-phosphoribosylamino)uracil reductase RibD [Rhodoferax sp.]MDZ7920315.1 bifunctional diaminohydroxyphosphoribosylaminopyrimidine deaminase/5-amino-6-(5-phosphoribosylamino)uracil reductase RibD [Rhodoferax sp.]